MLQRNLVEKGYDCLLEDLSLCRGWGITVNSREAGRRNVPHSEFMRGATKEYASPFTWRIPGMATVVVVVDHTLRGVVVVESGERASDARLCNKEEAR